MTNSETKNYATDLLLSICYDCPDAHKCETEQKCISCFKEYKYSDLIKEDVELVL